MMKKFHGTILAIVMAILGIALLASNATAMPIVEVNFGSDNDILGQFKRSTIADADTDTSWCTLADSVEFKNTGAVTNGTQNHSLLQKVYLNRSVGRWFTMTGTLNITTYADDNNRIGMYLFGDVDDLTADGGPQEDEIGALGLIYNLDDGQIRIYQGIDQAGLGDAPVNKVGTTPFTAGSPVPENVVTDYALTFETTFAFVNDGTNDNIDITFNMTDPNNDTTTATLTVLADDFKGNYFGFVGRGRNRGDNDSSPRIGPYVVNYETFSIVPEPATMALMGLGGLALLRRRGV